MAGLLANDWGAWILTTISFVLLAIALFALVTQWWGWVRVILALVVTMVIFVGAVWAHTHRIIPVNQVGIVLHKFEGTVIGGLRPSGITDIPFLAGDFFTLPATQNTQWCEDYTPSVKGGYEVKVKVCFYFDASKVDWMSQFSRYNVRGFDDVRKVWQDRARSRVALAVKDFEPRNLTDERAKVMDALLEQNKGWMAEESATVKSAELANWDFTSAEVRNEYNSTLASQTQTLVEEARLEAEKKRRLVEEFKAETVAKVLGTRATAHASYLSDVGVTDQGARATLLTVLNLEGQEKAASVILNTGSSSQVAVAPGR